MAARWTRDTEDRFVAALAETGSLSETVRRVGVSTSQAYARQRASASFRERCEEARQDARARLLSEIRRRALEGLEEPMIRGGLPVRDEHGQPVLLRRYSDRLLLYLVARIDRDVFRPGHERA